jgi:hypothetical protein
MPSGAWRCKACNWTKIHGYERVEGEAGQAFAQRFEQPWQLLEQVSPGFSVLLQADAPDQLVHGAQRRLPLQRLLAVLEADQQQHLAPGLLQELHHRARQHLAQQPPIERIRHPLTGRLGAHARLFGIAGVLLKQLAALAFIGGKRAELRKQLEKIAGSSTNSPSKRCTTCSMRT